MLHARASPVCTSGPEPAPALGTVWHRFVWPLGTITCNIIVVQLVGQNCWRCFESVHDIVAHVPHCGRLCATPSPVYYILCGPLTARALHRQREIHRLCCKCCPPGLAGCTVAQVVYPHALQCSPCRWQHVVQWLLYASLDTQQRISCGLYTAPAASAACSAWIMPLAFNRASPLAQRQSVPFQQCLGVLCPTPMQLGVQLRCI